MGARVRRITEPQVGGLCGASAIDMGVIRRPCIWLGAPLAVWSWLRAHVAFDLVLAVVDGAQVLLRYRSGEWGAETDKDLSNIPLDVTSTIVLDNISQFTDYNDPGSPVCTAACPVGQLSFIL